LNLIGFIFIILKENPITNHPEYKRTVLKYCMALQELDEVTVKDSDR
jgi:hypothetical protein